MEAAAHNLSIPPHALPPAIDAERLEEATGGDAEFGAEIIETFLGDASDRLDLMLAAAARGDVGAVAAEAHTIKGASANVGAPRMRDLALRVEQAAKRGDLSAVAGMVAKLKSEILRVRASR